MSKLLNQVRQTLRLHHYDRCYLFWMKRYFYFAHLVHPIELVVKDNGCPHLLSHLLSQVCQTRRTRTGHPIFSVTDFS